MGTTKVFKPIMLSDTKVFKPIMLSEAATVYRDFAPAVSNLYTVELFGQEPSQALYSVEAINDYLKFHSPSVTLPEETLNLERDPVTRTFKVAGSNTYTRATELTVTWREADDWRVKKYHENWLAKFYDRKTDKYQSYESNELSNAGLAKLMKITLPESVSFSAVDSAVDKKAWHTIELYVMPHNTGSLSLSWTASPSLITHSMTYYILDWNWIV